MKNTLAKISQTTSPEGMFVILCLIFGALFIAVIPPFQGADEDEHFKRAYQISQLHLIAHSQNGQNGDFLPSSLEKIYINPIISGLGDANSHFSYKSLKALLEIPLNPQDQQFLVFSDAAVYPPVPYWPLAIGIFVGRLFEAPPLALFYLARMANLLAYVLMCFWAIRLMPVMKWPLALIALMPQSVFQAASVSADGSTFGLAFLIFAGFLEMAFKTPSSIDRKDWVRQFALCSLLGLSKYVYVSFVMLFFLIPRQRIGSRLKYLSIFSLLFLTTVTPIALWIMSNVHVVPVDCASPSEQVRFILSQPFGFMCVLARTVYYAGFLSRFWGTLGYNAAQLPESLVWLEFMLLLLVILRDGKPMITIHWGRKLVIASVIASTLLMVAVVSYINWCPPGHSIVRYMIWRYFIPLAPLIAILFYRVRLNWRILATGGFIVILAWSILRVLLRY